MAYFGLVLLFGVGLSQYTVLAAGTNSIPTKEEQANLLSNVQDIFDELKKLVHEEGLSTDDAVADDINKIVDRAQDKLQLVEELSLLKISCASNKICALDAKTKIRNLVEECKAVLNKCAEKTKSDIIMSSKQLDHDTNVATSRGQAFLDSLRNCSEKKGLQVVSCYKNIIATDVIPVKNVILRSIADHRSAHERTMSIRKDANDCIDENLNLYQIKIAEILVDGLNCE